ncbi:MAG TPA: hypothetical protein VH878_10190 [Thermodesulfobacteriota bacterium]
MFGISVNVVEATEGQEGSVSGDLRSCWTNSEFDPKYKSKAVETTAKRNTVTVSHDGCFASRVDWRQGGVC